MILKKWHKYISIIQCEHTPQIQTWFNKMNADYFVLLGFLRLDIVSILQKSFSVLYHQNYFTNCLNT